MLLALVEDVICQQNRAGQEFYDENKKKDDLVTVTLGPMCIQGKQLNVTRLLKPLNWNWWWLWMGWRKLLHSDSKAITESQNSWGWKGSSSRVNWNRLPKIASSWMLSIQGWKIHSFSEQPLHGVQSHQYKSYSCVQMEFPKFQFVPIAFSFHCAPSTTQVNTLKSLFLLL